MTTPAKLELPFVAPYERERALDLLAAHAVPGAEIVDRSTFSVTRLLRVPSGQAAVTARLGVDSVTATVSGAERTDLAAVETALRFWLDLDRDPMSIVDAFSSDPLLGAMVSARPGLRVVGHLDGYEAAITTVLGQQVSLASARTFAGRLVAAYGQPGPAGLLAFPCAEVLAGVRPDELQRTVGLTRSRTATVLAVARACADGLVLRPGVDLAAARGALLTIPGVGPWTADYLAVRALGDRDAYPGGDLVLRRALGVRTAREAESLAEPWRPLRAYALFHIWTAAVFSRPA